MTFKDQFIITKTRNTEEIFLLAGIVHYMQYLDKN